MRYEYPTEQILFIKKYKDVGGEWILMAPASVFLVFLCYRIFTSSFFPSFEGICYVVLLVFVFCYLNYIWILRIGSRRNFTIEKRLEGVYVNKKKISNSTDEIKFQVKELVSFNKMPSLPQYEIILKGTFNKIYLVIGVKKEEAERMVQEVGSFLGIEAVWKESWI
ncbi:MAG: hypothetical protein IT247_04505 [Bacteroidia bacterium]|nr:hypothetical protein [Bacteroidia bacterium]